MTSGVTDVPARPSVANVYVRVMNALILRDMRTRFFGSHWGYAISLLWPVCHIFIVVIAMSIRGLESPMGDSVILFIATGAVPALLFKYISREVMKSYSSNKPLTYYPQVRVFDVIFARLLVEIVKGFSALIIVMGILMALGIDPFPVDPVTSIAGYSAALLLGVGIGVVNTGIVSVFPAWSMGYLLFAIILYLTSGVFFLPNLLPEEIYSLMKWNPLVQIIEWVRLGYNPALPVEIDYMYVFMWGMCSLLVGLVLERQVVRKN